MKGKYRFRKNMWVNANEAHISYCEEKKDILNFMRMHGGWIFRNEFDFDCKEETSFWHVIKDSFGGMEELSSKMRNQVKKSMKTYDFEIISKQEFLQIGCDIFNSALEHYKVKAQTISKDDFVRQFESWPDNTDYWCVYTKDAHRPVALAVNGVFQDSCQYWIMKADPSYLNSTYPYYGLIYKMNEYYLTGLNKRYVCDGIRSLTGHSQIQTFLIQKFNFRKAYNHLQVVYVWWIKLIICFLFPFRKFITQQQISAVLSLEAWLREQKR